MNNALRVVEVNTEVTSNNSLDQFEMFHKLFNATKKELPYSQEWENGTGYFDGVTNDESLDGISHGLYKSIDPSGRAMVIVISDHNPVVFFERFTNPLMKKIVINVPYELQKYGNYVSKFLGYGLEDHTQEKWSILEIIAALNIL